MSATWKHADHPDDERFDNVTIETVERWKESELSGDEWRFSYVVKVWRKGEVIKQKSWSKLAWAVEALPIFVNHGYPADDNFDADAWKRTADKCDQPGCLEVAEVFYARLKRYTKNGDLLAPNPYYDEQEYRQFCGKHKDRGDCALDDADHNYDELPGMPS